jgi:polysaccharide deacetylase 2 family uncharacterized protein YibQ
MMAFLRFVGMLVVAVGIVGGGAYVARLVLPPVRGPVVARPVSVKLPPPPNMPSTRPPLTAVETPGDAAAKPDKPPTSTLNGPAAAQALVPAPDPALVEESPSGPVPVIGRDGRQPWRVYARPFDRADKHPRIAIVISGLGLDSDATRQAVDQLPDNVTLSFDPYARQLVQQLNGARQSGHEVLLDLPMEPTDYPRQDPGPATLLTTLDDAQNLKRLVWVLSRGVGYVGVTGLSGSRFTSAKQSIQPVLVALKDRGLLFVDSRSSDQSIAAALARNIGMAWAVSNRLIDAEPSKEGVDHALADLEARANRDGVALGIGTPYPVTMERVGAWAATLAAKGLVLAPVSAIANQQAPPTVAAQ